MEQQFDVCVIGSANLDLVATTERLPGPGETVLGSTYAEHPGGKGLNQAVAAARAGARTSFCGALGDDAAADRLFGVLQDDGIDGSAVRRVAGLPTGRALIGVSAEAENSIIVVPGANATVRPDDIRASAESARVVLVQLEIPLDAVHAALAAARAVGATTVLNPAPAASLSAEILALCDVVIPNEHEVEILGGVEKLLGLGAGAVVVTRGSRGATLVTADGQSTTVEAFRVSAIDTTAAGDAFCGAFSAALSRGDDLRSAVRFASAAGAVATTRLGAVPSLPSLAEINQLVNVAG